MDPQQNIPDLTSPQNSNSKLKMFLILGVLVLLGFGAYFAYSQFSGTSDEGQPPSLEMSGSAFQGKSQKSDINHEFTSTYVSNYENPKWTKDISVNDWKDHQIVLKDNFKTNYLYSTESMTLTEIIGNVVPEEGNEMFFSIYNPEKSACVSESGSGYYIYKNAPYDDSIVIANADTFTVKPYCVFTLEMKKSAKVWGLRDHTTPISLDEFSGLMRDFQSVSGWVILPLADSKDIFEVAKNFSRDRVRKILEFSGDDFTSEDRSDLSKIKVKKDGYLAWFNFGAPKDCGEGKYLAGETCHSCPNAKFKDRECNYKEAKQGVVAHWYFDEKAGDILSDSVNFNDGFVSTPQWVKGKDGNALKFDGESTYAQIADSDDFSFTDGATFAAWVNAADVEKSAQIIQKGNHGIYLNEHSGWTAVFRVGGKNFTVSWDSKMDPRKDTWYHVVGVFDGEKIRIYVDGVESNSITKEGTLDSTDDPVMIGASDSGKYFDGLIDDVVVFDRALSKEDVSELYASYK